MPIAQPRPYHKRHTSTGQDRLGVALRLLILVGVITVPANADAGVPMLAITWPGMLLALVPVVLLESWVVKPRLELGAWRTLKLTLVTNLASTVIGIPLAWIVYFVFELIASAIGGSALGFTKPWEKFLACVITAPWLGPAESDLYWMIPAATLALLPAYFFASWKIECAVMQALVRRQPWESPAGPISEPEPVMVRRAVFAANIASYALLALVTLCWLISALAGGRPRS